MLVVGLLVAVSAATASMLAAGLQQRRVLAAAGVDVPLRSMLAITYASNAVSVTVPVAGSTAGTAFTYRQLRSRGADAPSLSWTLAMSGLFSAVALVLVLGVTAAAAGGGSGVGLAALGAGVVPLAVVLLARRIPRVLRACSRVADRVTRRSTRGAFERFAAHRLEPRAGAAATSWAILNWTADLACLAACIEAVGVSVPWPQLAAVYAAGLGAAAVSITPVGIGIVETALAVALVAAGVPWNVAIAAAIAYRATSCWLPVLVGWIALLRLRVRPAAAAVGVPR